MLDITHGGIEPHVEGVGRRDHRHSVVDRLEHLVRRGRQDGARLQRLAVGWVPPVPEAREGERLTVAELDVVGLLARSLPFPPLETISEIQAAAVLRALPESGRILLPVFIRRVERGSRDS